MAKARNQSDVARLLKERYASVYGACFLSLEGTMMNSKFSNSLQYTILAIIFGAIGYFASQAHAKWETGATRAEAIVVKAGMMPTVRFTPQNSEPVEIAVGTFSSTEHKVGDKLTILYKPSSSNVNNPPFDVGVLGVRSVYGGFFYLLACVFVIIAVVLSIRDSIKGVRK